MNPSGDGQPAGMRGRAGVARRGDRLALLAHGFLRDQPSEALARAQAAELGAGTVLEVLFSRGIPGASAWRR